MPRVRLIGNTELRFQRERLADVRHDVMPLLLRHWDEIALNKDTVPLDPDWAKYEALDKAGVYSITTARCQGRLIGYFSAIVGQNIKYRSVIDAVADIFWLDPEFRQGMAGVRLLKEAERHVIELGATKIVLRTKLSAEHFLGTLFERLGYTAIETAYAKKVN